MFIYFFVFRTNSLPNFLGTFVQPNLTITNNNNNIIINNNNKPTITVVQTTTGFHKVVDDDDVDIPMVVDDVKLQQQQQIQHQTVMNLSPELVKSTEQLSSENHLQDSVVENNNRRIKDEEDENLSPSSSPFIDINSLPMVFDDSKLFQNVSIYFDF